MTTLTLELSPELYERLHTEADYLDKPVGVVAQEWLAERLVPQARALIGERERATSALRAAGLLAELGPEMRKRAESSTATLEEISAAFERAEGKPLSEIILEQRGPKA